MEVLRERGRDREREEGSVGGKWGERGRGGGGGGHREGHVK